MTSAAFKGKRYKAMINGEPHWFCRKPTPNMLAQMRESYGDPKLAERRYAQCVYSAVHVQCWGVGGWQTNMTGDKCFKSHDEAWAAGFAEALQRGLVPKRGIDTY